MPVVGPTYPVALRLEGQPCLVVGGGRVATRKAYGLIEAGAAVHVIAIEVCDDMRSLEVTYHEKPYDSGDVVGFRLVITASNDPAVNRQVFVDSNTRGIWVNSADDPDNCSFILPAVVRQGPISLAISTNGHSPALASWLRAKLQDMLGPEYAVMLSLLEEQRTALQSRSTSTESVDWRGPLDAGLIDLVREGRLDEARKLLVFLAPLAP